MIRILHSVSNMDRAGIETMLMNYYRNIDRSEVQFDFLCNKSKPGAYDEEILKLGGRIYRTPGVNPFKIFEYKKYMQRLFEEHPEYKVLHAHNGAFAVSALYSAKISKIPVRIYHCHGASLIRDFKYPLKKICMKLLPYTYTHRWTCAKAAAEFYFGKSVVQRQQYRLITNAIDVEKFIFNKSTRDRIRKQYNLENKHVIGHVGRFMTQKNHSFLLDIFRDVHILNHNTKLVLLGDGELMPEIMQRASEYGLSEDILFLGNVENVNEWYQAFDLFILPSLYEGLPVVGIEAQAAGLSCIFSSAVTEEVAITKKAYFLDLSAATKVWAEFIADKLIDSSRKNEFLSVTEANYNIRAEAKKLQMLYMLLQSGEEIL